MTIEKNKLKMFCVELLRFIQKAESKEIPFINDMIKISEAINTKAAIDTVVSDLLEMSEDLNEGQIESLDDLLQSKELPTLTLLRAKKSGSVLAIVRRGIIETDDEFRLLNSFLNDATGNSVDSKVTESVNALLFEYESGRKISIT